MILTVNNPIVQDSAHSVGGIWGDYDNDGDLDLFVTNSKSNEANAEEAKVDSGSNENFGKEQ